MLVLADTEALIEADTLLLKLVLADSDALIEADTLLLKLVLADWLALIEADNYLAVVFAPIAGVLRFASAYATEIVLPKKAAEIAEKRKKG